MSKVSPCAPISNNVYQIFHPISNEVTSNSKNIPPQRRSVYNSLFRNYIGNDSIHKNIYTQLIKDLQSIEILKPHKVES